jgi:hypothetical protein
VLAAIGRNEDGDWLRVQNARYDGWMSELVLTVSGDPMLLPVLEIP